MSATVVQTDTVNLITRNHNKSESEPSDINEAQIKNTTYTTVTQIEITGVSKGTKEADTDIVILRKDPTTRRNLINKSAYAKLHRTLSPNRNGNAIDSLKEKYESNAKPDLIDVKSDINEVEITTKPQPTPPAKLDDEAVQSLKTKYSPASFGYPRTVPKNSKLPVAKPRGTVKSQIILPSPKNSDKEKARYSLNVDKKPASKDENSNELHRKNSSSSGEFVTIITRSESEGSVDKFGKELDLFTMDTKPKEKKRVNSFRKIFSGKIFSKDKKKKEEEKNKASVKENVANTDNLQNETNSFNRQSNYRHTVGGNSNVKPKEPRQVIRSDSDRYSNQQPQYITKEMEDRYAQMHVNQFNNIKHSFEYTNSGQVKQPTEGYVCMDKPIVKNNPGPTNYMNMPNVRKYIDTSSSASTLESDRSNIQNELAQINRELEAKFEHDGRNENYNSLKSVRFDNSRENSRDTPPRAQELRQDVRLVNPKALIPINSERPLPNPYQNSNSSTLDKPKDIQMENVNRSNENQARLDETYGVVFDRVEQNNRRPQPHVIKSNELKVEQKPPRSPSVEPTKLKLPPNREIVPLSPRVKSPIPHDNVSTEKIIATELLKPTKSPPPIRKSNTRLSSPSHQKLEIDIDYPDNISNERFQNRTMEKPPIAAKPPLSKIPSRKSPEASSSSANSLTRQSTAHNSPAFDNKRLSQTSPVSENLENTYARYRRSQASPAVENQERITTNAVVHVNSYARTPTPNNLLQNRSLSPVTPQSARSSTPVDFRSSPTTKSSPQKDDMRKSVEAYYWKEIKKLKDQENYDMYLYQFQMMPYGYAEDPVSVRRSRSLSPTAQRNSRRSLSLPRDPRSTNGVKDVPEMYGRIQPAPIPEGRAVVNQPQRNVTYGQLQYQPNFRRNAPERRTIDSTPRSYDNYNGTYRPIFKRGSLTTPVREQEEVQNKKVSFSGSDTQSLQGWPTKNGFTQSPPQRRVDSNRMSNVEDDVFMPNTPRTPIRYDGNEIYGYVNKPNLRYDYAPNPNEVIYYTRQNVELQNPEPIYDRNPNVRYTLNYSQDEGLYGQPADAVRPPYRLTRHGSIQLPEPLYDQRQINSRRRSFENGAIRPIQEPQYVSRQPGQAPNQVSGRFGIKREIILNDEIFGQFGGYVQSGNEYLQYQNRQNPVYASKQSVVESLYGRTGPPPKQVSVRNKVCDIYGQIHDTDSPPVGTPTQIRRTGVILGQLQSNPGSPQVTRQAHLSNEQFARNTRLTASANDMYRRYQTSDPRYRSDVVYNNNNARHQQQLLQQQQQDIAAPTRPLPPVPMKKGVMRNNSGRSETDSNASEMQKLNGSAKNKKRSFFGK